jgi:Tn3 transposase DDE domain
VLEIDGNSKFYVSSAARQEVFHGRRGQLRQKYRQGQEEQLGALGLVVNALVLWNTIYIQASLDHLRHRGVQINEEDVARLSPLGYDNFNVHGRYSFELPPRVAKGGLRSLRGSEWLDE